MAERERLGVDAIDVSWLARREERVPAQQGQPSSPASRPAPEAERLAALEPAATEKPRPFDYSTDHGDWPAYGGDLGARKYSPAEQISAGNVDSLRVAWVWEAFDNHRYVGKRGGERKVPDGFKVTPLMVGGRLFVRTAFSAVAALDPLSGETLWTYDPGTGDGPRPPQFGFSTRGLAYHQDGDGGRVLLVTSDGWLVALSPQTGLPLKDFGEDGRVDLAQGLRRPIRRTASTWNYAPRCAATWSWWATSRRTCRTSRAGATGSRTSL